VFQGGEGEADSALLTTELQKSRTEEEWKGDGAAAAAGGSVLCPFASGKNMHRSSSGRRSVIR